MIFQIEMLREHGEGLLKDLVDGYVTILTCRQFSKGQGFWEITAQDVMQETGRKGIFFLPECGIPVIPGAGASLGFSVCLLFVVW